MSMRVSTVETRGASLKSARPFFYPAAAVVSLLKGVRGHFWQPRHRKWLRKSAPAPATRRRGKFPAIDEGRRQCRSLAAGYPGLESSIFARRTVKSQIFWRSRALTEFLAKFQYWQRKYALTGQNVLTLTLMLWFRHEKNYLCLMIIRLIPPPEAMD